MHKTILFFAAALAISGCATTSDRASMSARPVAVVAAPQFPAQQARVVPANAPLVATADPNTASLRPGPTYIASFPEADRRAACQRLNYRDGTVEFARCLEGNFPENPYFTQQ